jgi:hypothetical protein
MTKQNKFRERIKGLRIISVVQKQGLDPQRIHLKEKQKLKKRRSNYIEK